MAEQSKRKIEIDGQEYTRYECSQLQRKLETQLRYAREEKAVYQAAGLDDLTRNATEKIRLLGNKYHEVSTKAGLPTRAERMKIYLKAVEKSAESGIMTGARIVDLFSDEAEKFAEMYYKEIRSFSTDVKRIAEHLGKSQDDIQQVKNYLFIDKSLFNPEENEWTQFLPDCAIAQSWQRLMIGKDIKPHDRLLIEHELYEMQIKREYPGIQHRKAHELASEKYDYAKEVEIYYGNLKKHKNGE